MEWLQTEFGEHLRSVAEHTDEVHAHLHFCVVNPDGGNVKHLHPGFRAAKDAQTPKEQRLAYNTAMRAFQDRFWEHVAGPVWTRSFGAGPPAQAALLQQAREIKRGTGERDRQLRSFAEQDHALQHVESPLLGHFLPLFQGQPLLGDGLECVR